MFNDHEKAKNVSSAIQSVVVSLAVVIGGCWTAWEFYHLDRIGQAKADLEAKRLEADQKAVVNIKLDAVNAKVGEAKFVKLRAVLTNNGERDAFLDYSKPVVSLTKVGIGENNTIKYGSPVVSHIYMPGGHIPNALIRDGESKEYPFAIPVKENGIYVIRFVAKVADENKRLPSGINDYEGEWSHQIIHIVE